MRGGAFEAAILLLGMSDSLLAGAFGGTDILKNSNIIKSRGFFDEHNTKPHISLVFFYFIFLFF